MLPESANKLLSECKNDDEKELVFRAWLLGVRNAIERFESVKSSDIKDYHKAMVLLYASAISVPLSKKEIEDFKRWATDNLEMIMVSMG